MDLMLSAMLYFGTFFCVKVDFFLQQHERNLERSGFERNGAILQFYMMFGACNTIAGDATNDA